MTLIAGHRGARNLWPENSLSGFRNLLALGVEAVEFDVHLTDAGELLVIHDPRLDRTTDRKGPVSTLPLGERKNVVLVGSDHEGIPTLDEVLALYAPTGLELHVELKDDASGTPYRGLVAEAAAAIDRYGLSARTFLTSFSTDVLARVREAAPHIRTLYSYHRPAAEALGLSAGLTRALAVADVVAVEKSLLLAEWAEITAMAPLDRLGAWVPNDETDIAFWLTQGLRQITTDRPDLAVRLRSTGAKELAAQ
jgi:glycerophosphoryl diester phosphodiesterase